MLLRVGFQVKVKIFNHNIGMSNNSLWTKQSISNYIQWLKVNWSTTFLTLVKASYLNKFVLCVCLRLERGVCWGTLASATVSTYTRLLHWLVIEAQHAITAQLMHTLHCYVGLGLYKNVSSCKEIACTCSRLVNPPETNVMFWLTHLIM